MIDEKRLKAIKGRMLLLFQRVMPMEVQERFVATNEGLREIIQEMGVTREELVATGLSIKIEGKEIVQIDESTAEKIYAAVSEAIVQNRRWNEVFGNKDSEDLGE